MEIVGEFTGYLDDNGDNIYYGSVMTSLYGFKAKVIKDGDGKPICKVIRDKFAEFAYLNEGVGWVILDRNTHPRELNRIFREEEERKHNEWKENQNKLQTK
jgi:hypothetical protein